VSQSPIQHVIVLMMENRSFDHMLGYLTIPNPVVLGDKIDGLTGTESNPNVAGNPRVMVSADAEYAGDYRVDPSHAFVDVNVQLFGANPVPAGAVPTNQGFVIDYAQQPGNDPSKAGRVMKCFAPERIPVLTTLAQQFAVCDRWYASVPGPTLPNRAFAHAATSNGHVDMNPLAYFGVSTLYEALDGAGVSSKIYGFDGNTSAFMFKQLFTRGNKFLGEFDDFLDDLNGTLPSYSFIEPRFNDWYDEATDQNFVANDQHPDNNVQAGEQLIADVYEAVRASKYWTNSLLVIVYDEHGGLFDHVPPPNGVASVDPSADFDFTRLGLRVPAIFISPCIQAGTISHNQFEHSSIAATARALFAPGIAPLTARAAQARPFHDIVNLDKPRDDAPTKLNRNPNVFQVDSNSHGQGSLNEHQLMQLLAAYHFDTLQPPDRRVLGRIVPQLTLQDLDTEQAAAVYIKAVAAQAAPAAFGAQA
jgi:phospholipase C